MSASGRSPFLQFLSLNVNGLATQSEKRRQLLAGILASRYDVVCLQETHHSSEAQARHWLQEGTGPGSSWLGTSFWCHNTDTDGNAKRGVAILFRASVPWSDIRQISSDQEGRVLAVDFSLYGNSYTVASVYAPSHPRGRPPFFATLRPHFAGCAGRCVVICGDFNCVADTALDVAAAAPTSPSPDDTPPASGAPEPALPDLPGAAAQPAVASGPAVGLGRGTRPGGGGESNRVGGARATTTRTTNPALARTVVRMSPRRSAVLAQRSVGDAGTGGARTTGFEELRIFMLHCRLADPWRLRHPAERDFTHVGRDSAARLDRILLSASFVDCVTADSFVDGLPGDHRGVLLQLTPRRGVLRGRGGWRLQPRLLADALFVRRLRHAIASYLASHPLSPSAAASLFFAARDHPPPPPPPAPPPPRPPDPAPTPPHSTNPPPSSPRPPPTPSPATNAPASPIPVTARERWDGVVDTIFTTAHAHGNHLRRTAGRDRALLQAAVDRAHAAATAPHPSPDALHAFTEARAALQEHGRQSARQSAAQAGVVERDFAEGPTFYFHSTHGRGDPEDRLLHTLEVPGASTAAPSRLLHLSTHDARCDAAEAIAAFYSSDSPDGLFRPGDVNAADQARMLAAVDHRLSPPDSASCDGLFSVAELRLALASLPRGKSPGSDGLPYELYTALWELLGDPLCDALNEAFVAGEDGGPALTTRQRTGTIVMLYKNAGGRQSLSNYRPITLFNADVKIAAKALARRLAPPLATVIDTTQTAYLPGRWIGDNVLCHLEEIDYLAAAQEPGAIVLLDFAKAFDRLHRGWLDQCLTALGFGAGVRRWVSVFLAGSQACVAFNGWFTDTFPTAGGVGQGSPLSPLMYVVAAQPLAARARQLQRDSCFSSIAMPDGGLAPPTHQHADDTTLHARTPADTAVLFQQAVQPFCAASGARINVSKTHGLLIGSAAGAQPFVDTSTGVAYGADPQLHCGIWLADADGTAARQQLLRKLRSIELTITTWSRHSLTYYGRVYVARQCLSSKLSHLHTFVALDAAISKEISTVVLGFVKTGGLLTAARRRGGVGMHPGQAVSTMPHQDGGIRMPDFKQAPLALKAKYAVALLEPAHHPWKAFAAQWLGRSAAWLLSHGNVAPRAIDRWGLGTAALTSSFRCAGILDLPRRVKDAFSAFQRLKAHRLGDPRQLSPRHVLREPLFFNRQILSPDGRPFGAGFEAIAAAGVCRVADLRGAAVVGLAQSPCALRRLADIEAALPLAWHQHLTASVTTTAGADRGGALLSPDGTLVLAAAAHGGHRVVYSVTADRSLRPSTAGPPDTALLHLWQQALLLRWDPTRPWRRQDQLASAALPSARYYLIGAWASVGLDPLTWGCGSTPLHHLTVRANTQRLRVMHLSTSGRPGYVVGQPVRPRVWEDDWAAPDGGLLGIRHVERRWAEAAAALAADVAASRVRMRDASAQASHASWMDPSPPRLPPRQRAAERRAASPPPPPPRPARDNRTDDTTDLCSRLPPPPPWTAVYLPLNQRRIPREHREVAWRLLHAALLCRAFVASWREGASPACPRPACAGRPADLSHIFITCGSAAPVVAWFCDVWATLEPSNRPPPSFAVIAAGDTAAWQPSNTELWHRLRLRLLYELWRSAEAMEGDADIPPSATASRIVSGAAADIRLDWLRATMPAHALADACGAWMTGAGTTLTPAAAREHFASLWCMGGHLCRLPAANSDVPDIRWSPTCPVPFPGRPPDGPNPDGRAGRPHRPSQPPPPLPTNAVHQRGGF